MELLVIQKDMPLAEVFRAENVDAILGQIKSKVAEFEPDITTAKGRKDIASIASKVAKSKTFLDGKGKELVAGWKDQAKLVDIERKRIRDDLDELKEEVRKPLTDYELAQKARDAEEGRIIARLVDLYDIPGDLEVSRYENYLVEADAIEITGDVLSDFHARATAEKERAVNSLNQKIAARVQHNKDQEELAKLRAEREERDKLEAAKKAEAEQKAREENIRKEAEQKAKEEAAKNIAAAEAKIEQANQDKIEAVADAKREAEQEAKDLADKAELERLAKETEERLEREAAEKKAANKKHRAKINKGIVEAITSVGTISEGQAMALVESISRGDFTHLSIDY